jgi:hypothetical protein
MIDGPMLFALNASHGFGLDVARALGIPLTAHEERQFEDEEHKTRPLENVRDRSVYVIQSLHGKGEQRRQKATDLFFSRWSGYRWHAGIGSQFDWLDIDSCFEGLGNCDDERAMRYREFVQSVIPAGEWELIREALHRGGN